MTVMLARPVRAHISSPKQETEKLKIAPTGDYAFRYMNLLELFSFKPPHFVRK